MRSFLTAEWRNLINITYPVDPAILQPHIPAPLQPDIREGKAYVSLVAFDFLNTRVRGMKIPWHVNFPEINLRFYVKYKEHRGVMFIREFVPRYMIASVARLIYNEPYRSTGMSSVVRIEKPYEVEHELRLKGKKYQVSVGAGPELIIPEKDSVEHFFKEHDLGFGLRRSGRVLAYFVEHPVWRILPVNYWKCTFDFGEVYGSKWSFLNDTEPVNVLLAEGSEIKVYSAIHLENLEEEKKVFDSLKST